MLCTQIAQHRIASRKQLFNGTKKICDHQYSAGAPFLGLSNKSSRPASKTLEIRTSTTVNLEDNQTGPITSSREAKKIIGLHFVSLATPVRNSTALVETC
jgi:hypothetical protein